MGNQGWARARIGRLATPALAAMLLLSGCGSAGSPVASNATSHTASGGAGRHSTTHKRGSANTDGVFFVDCKYSHTANDDPIVMPAMTNMSMLHDFFGNATTDATSTPASLRGGSTTCTTAADSSAYWTPVLYANGHPLRPTTMATYWHPASSTGPTPALPANLEMIAGDEHASLPQPLTRIAWVCHDNTGRKGTRTRAPKTQSPHVCGPNQHIKEEITFPNCWDDTTSSTAIAPEHVVYPDAAGGCPKDHPTALLVLRLNVMYPDPAMPGSPASPVDFTLSTSQGQQGSTDTAHADFIDAWPTPVIDKLIHTCLDTHTKCGKVTGPDGTPHEPKLHSRGR